MSARGNLSIVDQRRAAQLRVAATRAHIGDTWSDLEPIGMRAERTTVRAIVWARRASAVVALVLAWRALRGAPRGVRGSAAAALVATRGVLGAVRALRS